MVRPVTDDDIGLKVLREAPVEAAQIIDIVAIHGIGAHPDDTWCKNVGTEESPRWVNWLEKEDMLPAVVPNACIMRYGYQSQWFGAGAMQQNVSKVAKRLLLALLRKKKEYLPRPLIFIAHCFGGLVVLKALSDALHDTVQWPDIFDSITGLLFFGTPFRGAGGMSQMEMLEAAQQEYQEDEVQPEVLRILQPGDEFLQEVVDQFGRTRTLANKAQVACFYELKLSNVGKIVGKEDRTRFVVSESSGCLDLSDSVSKFSLSRTHFDMNKFGKPTDEDFETVRDVIKKMVDMAIPRNFARKSTLDTKDYVVRPGQSRNTKQVGQRICYACGEAGHYANQCPNECYACGEIGHWARDCPNECHVCGEIGHWARDCPNECHVCGEIGHWARECPDKRY